MSPPRWLSLLALLSACTGDTPQVTGPCDDLQTPDGDTVCVHAVPDLGVWDDISAPEVQVDKVDGTKYLVPRRADARLPTLILDMDAATLHADLLATYFPDLFPGLDSASYPPLVLGDQAEFYAGEITRYTTEDPSEWGLIIWDDPRDPNTTVTQQDVTTVWQALQPVFGLGELAFVPNTAAQRESVRRFVLPPFLIRGEQAVDYEAYTQGTGYGTVRLMTLTELAQAEATATLTVQDLLILDQAPFDVSRPIAGAVTGSRQGTLSHLNVRSAARGTPNCHIPLPLTELASWEGQLVALTCGEDALTLRPATLSEAQAFWDAQRPDPIVLPAPNLDERAMSGLLELDTSTPASRTANVATYGSKGSNLASLYQRTPADWQIDGFLIPFSAYNDFVTTQGWQVDLGEGLVTATFRETLEAWHADPDFLSDAALRQARLNALRDAMKAAEVDPVWLSAISERVTDIFGDPSVMVRLRSSANAEDALAFSGAGLYTSESACIDDDRDADTSGPSRCDATTSKERPLAKALTEVWSSAWTVPAWEERDWYGMDHLDVAMGVLVNTRSSDEQAQIVAFTGNPSADDPRFLIEAQPGEVAVVSAAPGVFPEESLLTLSNGLVTRIQRVRGSSELPPGAAVLDDARLHDLGARLAAIARDYPVDEPAPEGRTILLDSEWKILEDGRLIVKQVRPFLR